jgi:membrane fusion protein (multidrug efflux system)
VARIFRREALEHQARPQHEGHLLQLAPTWTHRAYWLLVMVCLAGAVYSVLGQINEYAAGTAIVKLDGRIDVTARAAATVESVEVRPGQRVRAQQVLMRLYFAGEAAELRRIEHEFDLQLIRMLRDPGDAAARSALTTLRAQRELARSRLEERTIRAPQDGVVSDIRIHPGQQLQPGELVLSLLGESAGFRLVAMIPGYYRPLVRRGMPIRLELHGYPYAYQWLSVDTVGDEVVGPAEVKRYLGQEVADTVTSQEPLVLVEARLPSRQFVDDGRVLEYYEGMQGKAEVRVRAESILVTLIPSLKAILRRDDGPGI